MLSPLANQKRLTPLKATMSELVLLRHGQSIWNRDKHFTGWADVPLTEKGRRQARRAAKTLRRAGFRPDACFSSRLCRAIETAELVVGALEMAELPVQREWRLNERHYGELQGMTPAEAMHRYGRADVRNWQRTFAAEPPALAPSDPRHPGRNPSYADISGARLPAAESIRGAQTRLISWYRDTLEPRLREGQRVLVVSHANQLKALIHFLEDLPEQSVPRIVIPVAAPISYSLDLELRATDRRFLGRTIASRITSLLMPRK